MATFFPVRSLLLLVIVVYLAGVATPLCVLRLLARDRNDSCFLSLLLGVIFCAIALATASGLAMALG